MNTPLMIIIALGMVCLIIWILVKYCMTFLKIIGMSLITIFSGAFCGFLIDLLVFLILFLVAQIEWNFYFTLLFVGLSTFSALFGIKKYYLLFGGDDVKPQKKAKLSTTPDEEAAAEGTAQAVQPVLPAESGVQTAEADTGRKPVLKAVVYSTNHLLLALLAGSGFGLAIELMIACGALPPNTSDTLLNIPLLFTLLCTTLAAAAYLLCVKLPDTQTIRPLQLKTLTLMFLFLPVQYLAFVAGSIAALLCGAEGNAVPAAACLIFGAPHLYLIIRILLLQRQKKPAKPKKMRSGRRKKPFCTFEEFCYLLILYDTCTIQINFFCLELICVILKSCENYGGFYNSRSYSSYSSSSLSSSGIRSSSVSCDCYDCYDGTHEYCDHV